MVEYLTVKEVAELLRIKERKVYELASKGTLPCSKAIGKLLFPRDQITKWLASNSEYSSLSSLSIRPDVFLGSHDPLLDWAIRESLCGMATLFDSSRDGLNRFANGDGIATGIHIPDLADNGWNTQAVAAQFSNHPVVLVEWAKRTRGIVLADGVFLANGTLASFKDLQIVPRQKGSGAQTFFENLLASAGVSLDELHFLEPARSEIDVVQSVSAGSAEAGFALESIATNFKLKFEPIAKERFDLLVDRRSWFEKPFQKLLAFARSDRFSAKAKELKGYDISELGTVYFNGA